MKKITAAIALTLTVLSLSACKDGQAKIMTEAKAVSAGQQLIDLKRATRIGAMTRDEYQSAKSKILSSNLTNNPRPTLID